ncbi:MAG TPA: PAS domain-containing sensor histidine kinase [Bacteroidales bacterium]|nr:PAS domain-containing sensor histidine kinase [Bacteroidales bacterium]HPS73365.1 PAS domain-containing sensor histidine kinase [Bacteroidales bacterium]
MLTVALGEMLGATCCFYTTLDKKKRVCCGACWNIPAGYTLTDNPEGHLGIEFLEPGKRGITLITHLEKTDYAQSEPIVKDLGLKTYFSKIVKLTGQSIGSLSVVYNRHFVPTHESEELLRIVASAISVQESLKMKMEEIRNREHQLKMMIDFTPDLAIQFFNMDGKIKFWNKASEHLYGFSEPEAMGRTLDQLILDTDSYQRFKEAMDHVGGTDEAVTVEFSARNKNGETRFILSTIFSIESISGEKNQRDFISLEIDLSDLKNAQIKLKEYTIQLEKLNATKDKFFSIIAHDLKNPFNTILGFSKILYSDYQELSDEQILKFIRAIRDSAENAFKLLQNLLIWCRLQSDTIEFFPEITSLNLMVNETLALLKPQAYSKRIHFIQAVDPSLQVYADENMIKTVLRNLISNGIKYAHPDGYVKITAQGNGNDVRIEVADNGIGIPPDLLSKLFVVGEKTERPGTAHEMGTGIGLILCRDFLEKHGTEIMVSSEPGKGSMFSFTLKKSAFSS